MTIEKPHRPCCEAEEFWYSAEHKALLYDVIVNDSAIYAEASHDSYQMHEHLPYGPIHTDPHGIEFADPKLTEAQQLSNVANVELGCVDIYRHSRESGNP